MRPHPLLAALCLLAAPNVAQQATDQPLDASLLFGLEARSIGPAAMSGRIGAVASVPGDPTILWVGAASGGVWKSRDGGVTFTAVFDDQDVTSIGAIAIDPRTPEVVWVGTGEGNPRNSASVGRGLFRTRDGGRTWQKLGLDKTEHIHRIVLHPTDPEVAYVAALGTTWADSEERGLFRTRDGGASWQKVLYADPRTGCCDVVMDPHNPDKLFAGMWDHRRTAWDFKSGGPGSGLFRSLDGGASWQRLEEHEGVPGGELGRSCFAVAPSDPSVVYCLVEAQKSALLRSDDGGFSFRAVRSGGDAAPRPFYFCDIRVDPRDENRVYSLHTVIDVSKDGGRTFEQLVGWNDAHPDHHSLWIDPLDPKRLVIGNDGGVYTSQDRGGSWRFCANLPLAQFYHVAVDHDVPYHVYGGLQDNGSWRGPSTVWENGGIRNLHWQEVCFGDGFATLPDPEDSMQGYAMSQGGALVRWDLRTGQQKGIQPPAPDGVELRFHWNSAIAQDPFDPATIYYGSQHVHVSNDRGASWRVISGDLSTNDPEKQKQDQSGGLTLDVTGAENHCTILSIAPSPVRQGVLWAATDDGRLHVTQDGGATWTSVEDRIDGLPKNTWCPHVEASKFRPGAAFVVFDDHRRANWTPYVFATDDYGQTWRSLATPQIDGYCLVIEQDPKAENLLFLGTEFGLYASVDGGAQWFAMKHGVPACSAMALVVHPRDGDLIVATHGRALFVIDDIAPLRTMSAELLRQPLHLFAPRDAILWTSKQTPAARFPGTGEFRGQTLRRGAMLTLIANGDALAHPDEKTERERKAKKAEEAAPDESKDEPKAEEDAAEPKDQATVEVRDAQGRIVRTFRAGLKLGLNRIWWNLERDGEPGLDRELVTETPEVPPSGREVLPGDYEVTVRFLGQEQKQGVRVLPDPRVAIPMADRMAKDALLQQATELRRPLRAALQRLARAQKDIELVRQRLALEARPKKGDEDPNKALRDAVDTAQKAADALTEELWGKKIEQGILRRQGLIGELFEQLGQLNDTPDAPNATERLAVTRAGALATAGADKVAAFEEGPLATFFAAVAQSGLSWPAAAK